MGFEYTNRIALSTPDKGECNWWYDWFRNTNIIEPLNAQDNSNNYVISGCAVTIGSGLSVDVASGSVVVNETEYTVTGGNVSLTPLSTEREQFNLLYIDSTGTLVVYPAGAIPTGNFALLAVADASDTACIRVGDLRRFVTADSGVIQTPVENDCINGAFDIWQRGTTFSSNGYTADRWILGLSGATGTVQRVDLLSQYSLGYQGTSKYALRLETTVANDNTNISTKVLDVRKYSGKSVTIVFQTSLLTSSFSVQAFQNFGSGGSTTVTVPSVSMVTSDTGSWRKYIVKFDIPSVSGKTIGDLSYTQFEISNPVNETFVAWFADVEIYPGDIELPTRRPIAEETLQQCLPYGELISSPNEATGNIMILAPYSTTGADGVVVCYPKIKMPYLSISGVSDFIADQSTVTGLVLDRPSSSNFSRMRLVVSVASGLTTRGVCTLRNNTNSSYMFLDSEI